MNSVKKIISVFLVVVMILTSIPLRGFAENELSDWFSSVVSAVNEKQQSSYVDISELKNREEIDLSKAPIQDKLSFELIRGRAHTISEKIIADFVPRDEEAKFQEKNSTDIKATYKKTVAVSEKTDTNTNWSYDESTHTLTISGVGPMEDYVHGDGDFLVDTPWIGFASDIEKIVIEEGITRIGNCAFAVCVNLKDVIIPNTVTEIGDFAFVYNAGLNKINLPNSLLKIGDASFGACWNLDEILIPESVTSVGKEAFAMCLDGI